MNETTNASETEASQSPAGVSNGSSDETRGLSGTAGSQLPLESLSDFSDVDPSKIGRYRIIRRLGQGGFGRVYLAYDDDLDRPVAVKLPNPERITRPEDAEAFLVEARILAKLDHPHIVPFMTWVARTTDSVSSCRSSSRAAILRSGWTRLDPLTGIRRNLLRQLPRHCITRTFAAWSTGTSSPRTS
jgi:serine/threonine protein kinase